MEVTTTAETTGVMKRRQYFANRPSTPSATPPAIMAPIAAPYPYCAAMVQSTVTNVKLTPMTMGKRDPTRHTGKQLDERADAGNDHSGLDDHGRLRRIQPRRCRHDSDRRQIRHEHGEHMLDAVRERFPERDFPFERPQLAQFVQHRRSRRDFRHVFCPFPSCPSHRAFMLGTPPRDAAS